MGLKLDPSLVGHFHMICASIALVHLEGKTDYRSEVLCLDPVPVPTLELLPGNGRWMIQALYPLLLGVLIRFILIDSRGLLCTRF